MFDVYVRSVPFTDGSKIMAVVSAVIPMDIGIQFAKQTCLTLTSCHCVAMDPRLRGDDNFFSVSFRAIGPRVTSHVGDIDPESRSL